MKIIKFLSLCLVLMCIIFALSGCNSHYYSYDELKDEIINIEIFKLAYRTTVEDAELIKTLNDGEKEDLLLDLSKIKFKNIVIGTSPPYLGEHVIKLYDNDDNYQVICFSASFKYDSTGQRISGKGWECSEEEFDSLISKFIEMDIK